MRKYSWLVLGLVAMGTTYLFAFDPPKSDSSGEKSTKGTTGKDKETVSSKSETGSKKSSSVKGTSKKVIIPTFNKLTKEEERVLVYKGTERAFAGKYTDTKTEGTYICRRCNAPLYNSKDKFHSGCGWPSFDDELKGAVTRQMDADGSGRVEILCSNCGGHLGHVFEGERMTSKNSRHCVNSISMVLIPKGKELPKVIKADGDDSVESETKAADLVKSLLGSDAEVKSDKPTSSDSKK